ncbi:DUF924 domain-containing protein [Pseudoalteromonas xiamenensis]|uniref:DUF924 family protein n=1 Tax=Pseudoalteromonas xiamenensis TaxID=882626 RepID=UPI0027E579CE|nr:DUF924 family protein [Pseudoalteromonas xiamenensis]WMN59665.1 DUF924 domain-containing protein [Pseudoalteromonas xiamenensis]
MQQAVLHFWFEEVESKQWFTVDEQFDELIQLRFGDVLQQAEAGELFPWRNSSEGRLAEIIVLDQFSRNVYRGQADAFKNDAMALVLAQEAISHGALHRLTQIECNFLLLPFMHSESLAIHHYAEPFFQEFTSASTVDFESKHRSIIEQFGRYPHRNKQLGRRSTDEEVAFLSMPHSSF